MKINLTKTVLAMGLCSLTAVALADDQLSDVNTNNMNDRNGLYDTVNTPQGFVQMAATTDMKEIHMSEIALQKSDNSEVKSFARELISDHKKSSKKLQAIAEKEGLNFPDTNSIALNDDRWNDHMNSRWHTNYSNDSTHPDTERQDMDSPPHLASTMVSNTNDNIEDHQANNYRTAGHDMAWDTMSGDQFDRAFINHMVTGHEKAISKFEAASTSLQDPDLKKYAEKTLPTLREHLRIAQKLQSKLGNWSNSDMTNSTSSNYRNQ